MLLAVTPHTSPQFSAPFPNDVVVVVDDKNSVEQVRQSDAFEEGGVAERDSFKHILKFFFTYLHRVYKRCWCMYTFHLGDQPADPRRCPAAKLTGREMKVLTDMWAEPYQRARSFRSVSTCSGQDHHAPSRPEVGGLRMLQCFATEKQE